MSIAEAMDGPRAQTALATDRSRSCQREIILALLLLIAYAFFRQIPVWNEYSRYDLVKALVDDHTTQIDPYHENTGDEAFYKGHYYSDKAPGSSLLAVPTYIVVRATAKLGGNEDLRAPAIIQMIAFTTCGITTVLLALLLFRFLRSLVDERWSLLMTLGYALGTIAWPFATMYFGHAASTFCLFAAFYNIWQWRANERKWRLILAGLLAGLGVLCEFPVGIGVAILGLYILWLGRRRALWFIVGGIPMLAVLLLYNWAAFGSPLSLGYQYTTIFAEQNSRGLFGVVWPKLTTAVDLLLAPRGLLRLSPWFALAPLGLVALRRRIRIEVQVCVAITIAFLLYNSGALNPFGGWTPGPRYLLPALPFATILVALAPRVFRPLILLQILFGIVVMACATATMPNAPESVADPLGELWVPRIVGLQLAQTTPWLQWGLSGAKPLILLSIIIAAAVVALYGTMRTGKGRNWLVGLPAAVMIGTFVALALPLDLTAAKSRASNPAETTTPVTILAAGITRVPKVDAPITFNPWAQIENTGGALQGTKVTFGVYGDAGARIWAAWHGNVDWQPGERKLLDVAWSSKDADPGTYRIGVTVTSADEATTYAVLDDIGEIVVPQ